MGLLKQAVMQECLQKTDPKEEKQTRLDTTFLSSNRELTYLILEEFVAPCEKSKRRILGLSLGIHCTQFAQLEKMFRGGDLLLLGIHPED